MSCKMGTMVEYSVFGQETTVDWTIISDAKGIYVQDHFLLCIFVMTRVDHKRWSLQSLYTPIPRPFP